MPSDRRIEPALEELSAYLDNELDPAARGRMEEHISGCADCRARLEGLRLTTSAIRALPMESPPRKFSLPPQAVHPRRWAPVGWLGGVAAAMLVVVFGISQLHGGGTTTSGSSASLNRGAGAAGQVAAPGIASSDQSSANYRAEKTTGGNRVTVTDPRNSSRQITVSTDRAVYPSSGIMAVSGFTTGDRTGSVTLVLRRGNYGVRLAPPQVVETTPGLAFSGSYSLSQLPLIDPRTGSYTLVVSWTDSSGATLIAELPVAIAG